MHLWLAVGKYSVITEGGWKAGPGNGFVVAGRSKPTEGGGHGAWLTGPVWAS